MFDKLDDSRAMFIPSYNPSPYWMIGAGLRLFNYGYSANEVADMWDSREFSFREKELFDELDSDIVLPRSLLMCHFHRPDIHQHLYGDKYIGNYDEEKLKRLYLEIDQLAGEIKDKALAKGYERIIFMSDHGLPSQHEHNENAFYSCNEELFGEEKPHITDFYNKIMELSKKPDK